jgi:hypothetical protein
MQFRISLNKNNIMEENVTNKQEVQENQQPQEQQQEFTIGNNPLDGLPAATEFLDKKMAEKKAEEPKKEEKQEPKTILKDEKKSEKADEVEQKQEQEVENKDEQKTENKPKKEETKEIEKQESEFENPLLSKLGKNKEESGLTEETEKSVLSIINKEVGKEFKSIDEFKDYNAKLKDEISNLQKDVNINKAALELIQKLPTPLFNAIEKFEKGEDYLSELSQSNSIDYSKSFDKQNLETLVKTLAPRKLPDEYESASELREILSESGDLDLIERIYNNQKSEYDKKVDGYTTQKKEFQGKFNKAYDNAINLCEEKLVGMFGHEVELQDTHKKDIGKVLDGGYNSILGMFFNEDGTYKDDAASKVAFLKYAPDAYKELVKKVTTKAKVEATTEATEDFVAKAADKSPSKTKVRSNTETSQEEAERIAREMLGITTKQIY